MDMGIISLFFQKLINNMESVFFHISTSRMNWVNYSKSKEIQELDHNEMDIKVREEQPPSNFKKYRIRYQNMIWLN